MKKKNEYPQFESDFNITVASPLGEWYDFNSYIYDVSAYEATLRLRKTFLVKLEN